MNPFALWTDILLKSGKAVLESMQSSAARAERPRVAVIPTADAPPLAQPREARRRKRAARPKTKAAAKPKPKAKAAARAEPKGKRPAKRARKARSR